MVAVLVVQATIDDVVGVVAVWNGFVATTFAVNVVGAGVGVIAFGGIGGVHIQAVFIVMAVVFVV